MLVPKPRAKPIPSFLQPNNVQQFNLQKMANDIVEFKKQSQESIDKALNEINKTNEETSKALADIKKFSQKIENDFENVTSELVGILKQIKSEGLKGDKGEDANEEAIEQRLLSKIPDVETIAQKAAEKVKPTPASLKIIKESMDLSGEDIVPKLNQAKNIDQLRLSMSNIKDWDKKWGDIRAEISRNKGGYHGGGDTVEAGTNVTLTRLPSGKVQINASGGGGTIYTDTVSGTIDGANTVFTVANNINTAFSLFLANSVYQPGVDFTVTGVKQITFVTAPDSSLSGQPFWLLHN